MKKHTTIISTVVIIFVALAVFLIYTGMRHASILDNVTVEVNNSDVAVKVFLEEMIPHHQEAVRNSRLVMNDMDITNPDIRALAAHIDDTQTFEVVKMDGWYQEWFGTYYDESKTLLRVPYEPMMGDLTALKGDALAKVYLRGMIDHHKHAIMTSAEIRNFIEKTEKAKGTSDGQLTIMNSMPAIDQTLILTKEIETNQTKEIQRMEMLLETL